MSFLRATSSKLAGFIFRGYSSFDRDSAGAYKTRYLIVSIEPSSAPFVPTEEMVDPYPISPLASLAVSLTDRQQSHSILANETSAIIFTSYVRKIHVMRARKSPTVVASGGVVFTTG